LGFFCVGFVACVFIREVSGSVLFEWFMRGGASRDESTFWPRVSLIVLAGKQGTETGGMTRSCL
jgi:hypothetical protein